MLGFLYLWYVCAYLFAVLKEKKFSHACFFFFFQWCQMPIVICCWEALCCNLISSQTQSLLIFFLNTKYEIIVLWLFNLHPPTHKPIPLTHTCTLKLPLYTHGLHSLVLESTGVNIGLRVWEQGHCRQHWWDRMPRRKDPQGLTASHGPRSLRSSSRVNPRQSWGERGSVGESGIVMMFESFTLSRGLSL